MRLISSCMPMISGLIGLSLCMVISCSTSVGEYVGGTPVGAVSVESSAGGASRVFLDGREIGAFHGDGTIIGGIAPGTYNATLFTEGYSFAHTTVTVVAGTTTSAVFTPVAVSNGTLSISPGASGLYAGSHVSIDGLDFGALGDTALTLSGIPSGAHTINYLFGSGSGTDEITIVANAVTSRTAHIKYQGMAFIEHFSNVSCNGCPEKAAVMMRTIDSIGMGRIVKVSMNANWPSANDPFYLPFSKELDKRVQYYAEYALPVFVVNGAVVKYTDNANLGVSLAAALGSALTDSSQYGLFIRMKDSLSGILGIDNRSASAITVDARVLLIEDRIELATPPGSNGETEFRQMYRGAQLDTADVTLEAGTMCAIPFTVQPGGYNRSQLSLAAYIQNRSAKTVLQSARTTF